MIDLKNKRNYLSNELDNTTGFLNLLLGETRDETSTDNDGLRDGTLGQDLTVTLNITKYPVRFSI